MDNQKVSIKKIAINYGLILGLLTIVISVLAYVTNHHIDRPWWVTVLSIGVMIWAIVYGLKAFKKENGGFMSLTEALKVGLAISLIAGIIGAIFNYIFITVIEPDFVNQVMEMSQQQMLEQNPDMSQEQIDMALSITEKFMNPGIMSAMAIIMTLFFGFITALIAGLVMKQNKPLH
ncbi:MAG: DUF4199 domain-containing protein [Flavobacteriales bacterium]